jgi:hypothetical protein
MAKRKMGASNKAGLGKLSGKKKSFNISKDGKFKIILVEPGTETSYSILDKVGITDPEKKAKGGRAGFKMGSKCKLATKGKGRAYGKNS